MKQVFRLMGMPDSIIAFDELPKEYVKGFELGRADGFPRHWKDYLGRMDKITRIPNERDPHSNQIIKYEPIVENDCFFYLVDKTIGKDVEAWENICAYVKRVVDKDFRLAEKIESMAKPLASNKTDGVTLEPEDVIIIPIPVENLDKKDKLEPVAEKELSKSVPRGEVFKCPENGCPSEFEGTYGKNSLRMHMKKHQKKESVAA